MLRVWVDGLRQEGGLFMKGKLNYLFMEDGGKGIIEGHQKREVICPRDEDERALAQDDLSREKTRGLRERGALEGSERLQRASRCLTRHPTRQYLNPR